MPCKICQQKSVWKFTNKRQLCKKCFSEYFEKKLKNTIRKYQMPISILRRSNLKNNIINSVIKNIPERKGKISLESLDELSSKVLYIMMYRNSRELKKLLPKNQPLYFLSDEEIVLYGKIKKIKGKIEKQEKKLKKEKRLKGINNFIKTIEQKNPDIRHNIVMALLRAEIQNEPPVPKGSGI